MRKIANLNTYFKLLLLIISTSILFFVFYISLYAYTNQQENNVRETTLNQYNSDIKSLLKLNSVKYTTTIADVTYWDDLVNYTKTKDKKWFDKYIVSEFPSYDVSYIGVYGIDNQYINSVSTPNFLYKNFIRKEVFAKLNKSKFISYYKATPQGVVQVFGATIHPSNDPEKIKYKPSGYFFMVRPLDVDYFKNVDKISNSKVVLLDKNTKVENQEDYIITTSNLYDFNNNFVAKLSFQRSFDLNFKSTKKILIFIIIASIINILIYLFYSRKWIYRPLKLITNVLESSDSSAITKLKNAPGEFGYFGNLFEENNNQKNQLLISKLKAEESDKLKTSFLANMSHEIRTPMNAIVGFSDLLDNKNLSEKDKLEYISIIKNSGKNLVSIIEDLIEMSRIDANQIIPNYKGINIDKCIIDVFTTIKVTIPIEKKIDFKIQNPNEKLEKNIVTDEVKLRQILVNLITNAIKFTDVGKVSFGYKIIEKEGLLKFEVVDTGVGIDEKNVKIIFDRFRRIEDDFSVELSGLGLGLAISKAYVEMLGGSINVHSKLGVGSVFSFSIPLKYELSTNDSAEKIKKPSSKIDGNQTILVAEDDNINFMLISRILQIKNFTIIRAVNGQEAVDIVKENPNIDLIFMDIKMPIMDGYSAFKIIHGLKPSLPIIAQTAHSSLEDKEKVMQMGFTNYITKPLDKERIFEILDALFSS